MILTDSSDPEEMKRVVQAIDEISIKAVELGGTLTGERHRDRQAGDDAVGARRCGNGNHEKHQDGL